MQTFAIYLLIKCDIAFYKIKIYIIKVKMAGIGLECKISDGECDNSDK